MKRFISFFIAMVMAALALPVSAEAAEKEIFTGYEVLSALGIKIDDYSPDAQISRGQTAKVISTVAGLKPRENEATGYYDVAENHSLAPYIKAVSDAGIMHGTENGFFEPDRTVTYAELARTLLVMMNYNVYAEAKGGYISGYMNTADRLKLSKGTGGLAYDTPLSGAAFARVIYNALDKEVLQVSSFDGSGVGYETVKGETLAYKYLDVKKGEGRVNATSKTAIVGGKASEGKIKIEEEVVNENGSAGAKWLGYMVEYWARVYDDGSTPDLLYIAPNGDETTKTVRAYDIINIKGLKMNYYDGSEEEDITMSEDMVCIYNGEVIDYTQADLKPSDGSVEFIINASNRAEAAIVRDYKYGVVKSITSSGNKIIFDDMSYMRLDDYDDWQIIKKGRSITLIELAAGDILNILVTKDGKSVQIEASGASVAGKIGGVYEENGKMTALVGETECVISPSYAEFGSEMKLGFEGEWYTNIFGDIFASSKLKSGSMEYGYLISYRLVDEPEESVKIKLYTVGGDFISVFGTDRISLLDGEDGSSQKLDGQELYEHMKTLDIKPQLVKYTLDTDGSLKKIQFAKQNYNRAEGKNVREVGSYGTGSFTLDYTADGGTTGYYQIGIFDCSYWLDEKAPIFKIPEDKNDTKGYSVIERADLTRKLYYNTELYDVNEDYEAQACVINLAGASASYNWTTVRVALVDKNIQKYIESEGVSAYALSIYQDGKSLEIYGDDGEMTTSENVQNRYRGVKLKDLKPGDVIAYSADSSGMIKNFELMYSYELEDGSYFAYSNETGTPTKLDYSAEVLIEYGVVKAATSNGLVVNARDGGSDSSWNHYFALETKLTRTFMFDSETKKWKSVQFASVKKGDRVLIRMQGYGLWEVLIYE